jgi:Flp pilus assembly protein TadG
MSMKRETGQKTKRKSIGQSIVEFTILLPLLLILISGLVEFGFMLNQYLDLSDAAREAARFAADDDPIRDETGTYVGFNSAYYTRAQTVALDSIEIGSNGQVELDVVSDDVVISNFAVIDGLVIVRFPTGWGENGIALYNNHVSKFSSADVNSLLDPSAPNAGLVLVEIYYDYHMLLALPWITPFVPNPVTLHAYSFMPNANVEPTPTP